MGLLSDINQRAQLRYLWRCISFPRKSIECQHLFGNFRQADIHLSNVIAPRSDRADRRSPEIKNRVRPSSSRPIIGDVGEIRSLN